MKRLASIAFLGLALFAPALLSGCGEEAKTDAKPAGDAAKPAGDVAKPAGDAAKPAG